MKIENVLEILARPLPSHPDIQSSDEFDPWDIFPCLYGTYSSDFDQCAIAVLESLLKRPGDGRSDLAAEMFREMLCTSDLCDYGTSPRVCFPTPEFREILPDLIEKWRAWSLWSWGGVTDHDP